MSLTCDHTTARAEAWRPPGRVRAGRGAEGRVISEVSDQHPRTVTVWPDESSRAVASGTVLTIDDLRELLMLTEAPTLRELAGLNS